MAIIDFVKPDKVVMLESNDFAGSFEFRPLEPGFGITIGTFGEGTKVAKFLCRLGILMHKHIGHTNVVDAPFVKVRRPHQLHHC